MLSFTINLKHNHIILKWISHYRLPACFISRDLVIEWKFLWLISLTWQYKYLFLYVNTSQALLIKGLTMTVSVNRLGLEVILKYIQCSSKCIAGLDTFTYPYTNGSQLVQSMFTLQHRYRASPVFLWSCHGDCKLTCLFNNEDVFFRHFVNHPQGLPGWLKFEWACFTCFSLLLPVCLYCLLENCNLSGENP